MAGKRHIRLQNPRDWLRLLAKVTNEYRREEVDAEHVRAIGYIAKVYSEVSKASEMEDRVEALEKLVTARLNQNDKTEVM